MKDLNKVYEQNERMKAERLAKEAAQEQAKQEQEKVLEGKKSFVVYHDWKQYFELLKTDERRGKLIMLLFTFAVSGEIAETGDESIDIVSSILCAQIARDRDKYLDICKKRSEAAKKSHPNDN